MYFLVALKILRKVADSMRLNGGLLKRVELYELLISQSQTGIMKILQDFINIFADDHELNYR